MHHREHFKDPIDTPWRRNAEEIIRTIISSRSLHVHDITWTDVSLQIAVSQNAAVAEAPPVSVLTKLTTALQLALADRCSPEDFKKVREYVTLTLALIFAND